MNYSHWIVINLIPKCFKYDLNGLVWFDFYIKKIVNMINYSLFNCHQNVVWSTINSVVMFDMILNIGSKSKGSSLSKPSMFDTLCLRGEVGIKLCFIANMWPIIVVSPMITFTMLLWIQLKISSFMFEIIKLLLKFSIELSFINNFNVVIKSMRAFEPFYVMSINFCYAIYFCLWTFCTLPMWCPIETNSFAISSYGIGDFALAQPDCYYIYFDKIMLIALQACEEHVEIVVLYEVTPLIVYCWPRQM